MSVSVSIIPRDVQEQADKLQDSDDERAKRNRTQGQR